MYSWFTEDWMYFLTIESSGPVYRNLVYSCYGKERGTDSNCGGTVPVGQNQKISCCSPITTAGWTHQTRDNRRREVSMSSKTQSKHWEISVFYQAAAFGEVGERTGDREEMKTEVSGGWVRQEDSRDSSSSCVLTPKSRLLCLSITLGHASFRQAVGRASHARWQGHDLDSSHWSLQPPGV